MKPLLDKARSLSEEAVAAVESIVVVESPSEDLPACRRAIEATAAVSDSWLSAPATVVELGNGTCGLRWGPTTPRVLLLGHVDTVWPLGTITRLPFTRIDDRMTGPGIFDMKTGVIQALLALRLAESTEDVGLLLTTDEEIGSHGSREAISVACSRAEAVLVFEPSADGALKTRRKGTSWYRLNFVGRAAHAGLDPHRGVNALLAAASASVDLVELADGDTTVTPTLLTAGTTANTVPASAELTIDVRAWSSDEQQRVDRGIRGYSSTRGSMTVSGGVDRPALEHSMTQSLFAIAQRVAHDLGLPPLAEASVGGASDGNLTAAAGVGTLDGLGALGDGAHADHEWASVSGMVERAALAAGIIEALIEKRPA